LARVLQNLIQTLSAKRYAVNFIQTVTTLAKNGVAIVYFTQSKKQKNGKESELSMVFVR